MYKNIITFILSCIIGFCVVYTFGVTYFYININKEHPYHIKDLKSLNFHKKYSRKLHHIAGVPGMNENENIHPENYLFKEVNKFSKDKNNILIQGDSYVELLNNYEDSLNLLKDFSKAKNIGLINAGISSYSPSLMSLQLDVLEQDFNIYPNILIAYIDQSDVGDEFCRYKDKRVFDQKNNLIQIQEEKYSRNGFDYTKIHYESEIFLSNNSKIIKAVKVMNFNIKYKTLKQKKRIYEKIERIKIYGWKKRKLPKCEWSDIVKPLIENDKNQIAYFENRVDDYLNKVSKKNHLKKIFVVTFPHKANLFPVTIKSGKEIYYMFDVENVIKRISKKYKNVSYINFNNELKGKEQHIFDNAYFEDSTHLNSTFHTNIFAKIILEKLEKYLQKY